MEDLQANKADIENTIASLPESPGIYMMKNREKEIIYVGKAKNLRNRVKSYFSATAEKDLKTSHLVKKIYSIEIITTITEYEALILENNLIKQWKPKYNISLKDSKTFPIIRITGEEFPRVFRTRKIVDDNSIYFGPFPDVKRIDLYLDLIKKRFKIRKCKEIPLRSKKAPCLYHHIGQCSAPCTGTGDKATYRKEVKTIIAILSGKTVKIIKEFEKKMKIASTATDFEKAAEYRDLIISIKSLSIEQNVQDFSGEEKDFIAILSSGINSCAVVLQMREGKLSGKSVFNFTSCSQHQEDMSRFLMEYYTAFSASQVVNSEFFDNKSTVQTASPEITLPKKICVNVMPEKELLEKFFADRLGSTAPIFNPDLPSDERERSIMVMAEENCRLELINREKERTLEDALKEIKEKLGLRKIPLRIEGFDIAHLSGKNTVASMVSFYKGKPDKSEYRIFRIKSLAPGAIDDYASIREAVARRYTRLLNENIPLPDLVLIDGGKGQLSAAIGVFDALGLSEQDTAALAKQEELLFTPSKKAAVKLEEGSLALRILQHIRDESHRFATTFNKNMRKKELSFSLLEDIPGVGQKRSKKLITKFGSLENIKKAGSYAISEQASMPLQVAEAVVKYITENKQD